MNTYTTDILTFWGACLTFGIIFYAVSKREFIWDAIKSFGDRFDIFGHILKILTVFIASIFGVFLTVVLFVSVTSIIILFQRLLQFINNL